MKGEVGGSRERAGRWREGEEDVVLEDLSNLDMENFEHYKSLRKEIKRFKENNFNHFCKCSLSRICGILLQHYENLNKLKPESETLVKLFKDSENEIQQLINVANKLLPDKDHCNHHIKQFKE